MSANLFKASMCSCLSLMSTNVAVSENVFLIILAILVGWLFLIIV